MESNWLLATTLTLVEHYHSTTKIETMPLDGGTMSYDSDIRFATHYLANRVRISDRKQPHVLHSNFTHPNSTFKHNVLIQNHFLQ